MSAKDKSAQAAYAKVLRNLFSASDEEVMAAVKELSDSGDDQAIFPLLEVLLNGSDDAQQAVTSVLYQLKNRKAAQALVEALENPKYIPVRKTILASFWNSGIMPVDKLPLLCAIAAEGDFEEAFEVLTIVEAMDVQLEPAELEPAEEAVREFLMHHDDSHPCHGIMESLQVALSNLESHNG
ncbi:MAG: hypothetical protein EA392_04255 [Cryomorphaceae bacterium]|nr:MAG: hypothetical protein EA392_04255 [Cryomorphaceae bacterium]